MQGLRQPLPDSAGQGLSAAGIADQKGTAVTWRFEYRQPTGGK